VSTESVGFVRPEGCCISAPEVPSADRDMWQSKVSGQSDSRPATSTPLLHISACLFCASDLVSSCDRAESCFVDTVLRRRHPELVGLDFEVGR